MKVIASAEFTIRPADLRTTIQFSQKPDTYEILDSSGDRHAWAADEQEALNILTRALDETGFDWDVGRET